MKRGSVRLLVVLYSINVFLTLSLSLFGLCRHWWERRLYQLDWKAKFAVAAIGFIVCAAILIVILAEKLMLGGWRSEEHTSELQSLMRISYAVFCLKNKTPNTTRTHTCTTN